MIQLTRQKPKIFIIISKMTSLPRHFSCDVSVCQIGAVAVLIPLPILSLNTSSMQRNQDKLIEQLTLFTHPRIMRPTNICAKLKEAACSTAPIAIIVVPSRIAFFRPSCSPIVKATIAPKKQPTSYIAVTVESVLVFSGPTRSWTSRKSRVITTPPAVC